MKKKIEKKRKPERKSTLQDWVMVPVTDPAEFAELERRVRAAEKEMRREEARKTKPSRGK